MTLLHPALLCPLLPLSLSLSGVISAAPSEGGLADHPSAHLRAHADDMVQWQPWNDETFAKALAEKKLVFASIGYSACHWCAKMQADSFSDKAIAVPLNKNFISVKVDRLERPDLDLTFRTYAQATGNSTGWPINVWLTPTGNPVSISGFIPNDTTGGKTSAFNSVITHIASQWQKHPDYVHDQSIRDLLKISTGLQRKPFKDFEAIDPASVGESFHSAASASFDSISGGFDTTIKFPRQEIIETIAFSMRGQKEGSFRARQSQKMVTRTLDGILDGAMADPIDGGLFRYANDSRWRVPQFERFLIDQARFANSLLSAFQQSGDSRYAHAAKRALDFSIAQLGRGDGVFFSTLAANSASAEDGSPGLGTYYLWQATELKSLLTAEEMAAASAALGIRSDGNVSASTSLKGLPRNTNILYAKSPQAHSPTAGSPLASAIEKMRGARSKRPSPFRNEMVITSWNGLMIGALARAATILDEPSYLARARAAAETISTKLFDAEKSQLARGLSGEHVLGQAYAEDYIFLARGFIELYRADGAPEDLRSAIQLQSIADENFFASSTGLYHYTPYAAEASGALPLWAISDGDMPSVNGIAALNQLDLAAIDGSAERKETASEIFRATTPEVGAAPIGSATLVRAILQSAAGSTQAIVSGRADAPATAELLAATRRHAPLGISVLAMDGGSNEKALLALRPALEKFKSPETGAKLYLCRDLDPGDPVDSASSVPEALAAFSKIR